tara:strand:+ start:24 stop:560 length:537 start_codon:yes stop_codon:yes gene_type:complete
MNYVKIYQFPQNTPANNIIGVVNAKLLENINWYIRPSSPGAGDQEYQIHGMYYGSSADVDFSLNIANLTSPVPVGSVNFPSQIYDTDAKRARIMNIIVDKITKLCQDTFVKDPVQNYYPPFNIGTNFVIESNPFAPAEQILPPGEEFGPGGPLEPGMEPIEPPFPGEPGAPFPEESFG